MIVGHEEVELQTVLWNGLSLPVFSPVSQPSAINLPTDQVSFRFHLSGLDPVFFLDTVVDSDVGPFPMAFLYVFKPVHIIFWNIWKSNLLP